MRLRQRFDVVALPALLAGIFVLSQLFALPADAFSSDSYRYDLLARGYLGQSVASAQRAADADWCAETAEQDFRARLLLPGSGSFPAPKRVDARACEQHLAGALLPPADPRYTAIFSARPGYPLLATPLVALLGARTGLRLTSVLLTALAGGLVFATLRTLLPAARRRVPVLGQALCYLCPAASYGVRPLTEGAELLGLTAALLGVALCFSPPARGPGPLRLWAGGGLLAAAYLLLGLARYATALPLALLMAVGAAACLALRRGGDAGVAVVGVVSFAAVLAVVLASAALRLPSFATSLQELFSGHFTRPAVADPVHRLLLLDERFWWQWLQTTALAPVLPVALVLAGLGLRRVPAPVAVFLAACAVTGLATVAAHPTVYEAERLMLPVWLPVLVGAPLLGPWPDRPTVLRRPALGAPPAEGRGRFAAWSGPAEYIRYEADPPPRDAPHRPPHPGRPVRPRP